MYDNEYTHFLYNMHPTFIKSLDFSQLGPYINIYPEQHK